MDPFQSRIKIGIDFGGDSLKIGMSVVQWHEEDEEFEEEKENMNSVNKVLLLAIGNVTLDSISAASSLLLISLNYLDILLFYYDYFINLLNFYTWVYQHLIERLPLTFFSETYTVNQLNQSCYLAHIYNCLFI